MAEPFVEQTVDTPRPTFVVEEPTVLAPPDWRAEYVPAAAEPDPGPEAAWPPGPDPQPDPAPDWDPGPAPVTAEVSEPEAPPPVSPRFEPQPQDVVSSGHVVVQVFDQPDPNDEDAMTKQADLNDLLRTFASSVSDVNGVVLGSRDGLPIAATIAGDDATRLSAMAATVLSLADQAVATGSNGNGSHTPDGHTLIRGTDGCLLVYAVGTTGALAIRTVASPNVGLVQVEAPSVAAGLAAVLQS